MGGSMTKPHFRCYATLHPVSSPDKEGLYRKVRGGLIAKGSSLTEWCEQQGVLRQTAYKALVGERNGPKAQQLRTQLAAEVGVK